MHRFSRTEKLIGEELLKKLCAKNILIVGLGGVGGYAFECLVRSGISSFTIVDGDKVDVTNINRQIIANSFNIGEYKVDEAKKRAESINPDITVRAFRFNYTKETKAQILDERYDYCVDCFDSVSDKIDFIVSCNELDIPLISASGAGNRTDPDFKVTDIFKTAYDPLAKAVRTRLKDTPVKKLKTVCDSKMPLKSEGVPASISYAPAMMGCVIAKEVIKDLIDKE